MKRVAYFSCFLVAIFAFAYLFPLGFDFFLTKPLDKTHLFYSAPLKEFVFTEDLHNNKNGAKSEDHHDSIIYESQSGRKMTRLEFEKALPFIYYRNAELRGELPLNLQGKSITKEAIEKERRVLEVLSKDLYFKNPNNAVYPIFERKNTQVAITFLNQRFMLKDDAIVFINSDTNSKMEQKSKIYTEALQNSGFKFPAKLVSGNFTNFKPYDAGVFLSDSKGDLFVLSLSKDAPEIKTLKRFTKGEIIHIMLAESKQKRFLGIAISDTNALFLIAENTLEFIPLTLQNFDANTMDLKVVIDPLNILVVYSDEKMLYASVFDRENFTLLSTFSKQMSRSYANIQSTIKSIVFPFYITLEKESQRDLGVYVVLSHNPFALLFNFALMVLFIVLFRNKINFFKAIFVIPFGIYGFFTLLFI